MVSKWQVPRDGDKPAIIYANGNQMWYQNGILHRDGDKPAIIYRDGDMIWYKNGQQYTPKQSGNSGDKLV